jgi:protein TonB
MPFAAVAGVLFTVALFFGLWQLVGQPLEIIARPVGPLVDYTPKRVVAPIIIVDVEMLIHEPPRPKLTIPGLGLDTIDESTVRMRPDLVRVGGVSRAGVRQGGGIPMGVDRDAMPIIRVDPVYPPSFEARGIEGWVRVQFNVTETGAVSDAIVVDSKPGDPFDEAALEAVARWRYHPRVVNGEATDRVGLQTLIRFTIENR